MSEFTLHVFKNQPDWEIQGISSTTATEWGHLVTKLAGTKVIAEEETNKMMDASLAKSLTASKEKSGYRLEGEKNTCIVLCFSWQVIYNRNLSYCDTEA